MERVYRGLRYRKSDNLQGSERVGWNTRFVLYELVKTTPKLLVFHSEELKDTVQFSKSSWAKFDKIYHSKHHEYFYKTKPNKDPEHKYADIPLSAYQRGVPVRSLGILGLPWPCSQDDAKRAFRRMSKEAHPDTGGSHEKFIELKKAYDEVCQSVPLLPVQSKHRSGQWSCSCGARIKLDVAGNMADYLINALLNPHVGNGHVLSQVG